MFSAKLPLFVTMNTFRRANIITGWIVFLISAVVYLLTKEPAASFWDCGEFIASSYKLEVGHPPGAPFFMLISNQALSRLQNGSILCPHLQVR